MKKLILYLVVGLIAMLILSVPRNKTYKFNIWRILVINILLVITGTFGTMLMYYIESGSWGGTSFYGSVFFIPLMFILVAPIVRVPYWKLMDYCASQICMMLAVMKVRCYNEGCCAGRILYHNSESGKDVVFPSQIAEAITVIIILLVLIRLERKDGNGNKLFPVFLISYGVTRFILNSFRGGLSYYWGILANGHIWSLVSILLGLLILFVMKRNKAVINI